MKSWLAVGIALLAYWNVQDAWAGKSYVAKRTRRAPAIDGKLNDRAWAQATFIDDFLQKQPIEYGTPTQRTEVALLYDSKAIYVAARMHSASRDEIQAVMTQRDVTGAAERIIVSFDTFHNRRTAYSFAVTAAGVRAEWVHTDDSEFQRDASFDAVWIAKTQFTDKGWTAEMRIPFSQLRFPARKRQIWGFNINRFIPQGAEDIFWIPVPKDKIGWSSYFGELRGLQDVDPGLRIELLPYVASDVRITSSELLAADDPFAERVSEGADIGFNAKIGLGSNFTIDAAINPDFGQVEADPAQVNLSAFEIFFQERRPFFIEGNMLLKGNGPQYYYSRRVGAPPHIFPTGDFSDVPATTRILGAAKLTGRTMNNVAVGALTALTAETDAQTFDVTSGETSTVVVEPTTLFNVARIEKEFGKYTSKVGAGLTGLYRNMDQDIASQLVRHAYAGGVDWNLRFAEAAYEFGGHAGFSLVNGDPDAIAAVQQSSAHFFQRPDQDHAVLDLDRKTMTGYSAAAFVAKRSGAWRSQVNISAESPGFEINDVGLLFSADDLGVSGSLEYFETEPGNLLHNWNLSSYVAQEFNYGGDRKRAMINLSSGLTFSNFWSLNLWSNIQPPGFSDDLTRGGPLMKQRWGTNGGFSVGNNFAARTRWTLNGNYSLEQTGPSGVSVNTTITLRPVDRTEISLYTAFQQDRNNQQYVTTEPGGPDATFNSRYIFGDLRLRRLATRLRGQFSFTPNLALTAYAEAFAASVQYQSYGHLRSAGDSDLVVYGEEPGTTISDNSDGTLAITDATGSFNLAPRDLLFLSLRSTLVLRWEFIPGSTLFLVWQQNRGESGIPTRRATLNELGDTLTTPGAHTLAVKFSYWWSR